jgi:hypothetical protein
MANIDGIITEDIRQTIAPGHTVYDREGKKAGTISMVYYDTGYFSVEPAPFSDRRRPFSDKDLHVPFHLITNIDPRELFLSVSRDELQRDYANPPPSSTFVKDVDGRQVATTTEPSGYTGAPIVVERVRIDQLKKRIAVGDHVYTSELTDLGTIKRYDALTGWMLVEKGVLSDKHDLMVPVTVVDDVNRETNEVYLVASEADLQRMQHVKPAYVVFVDAKVRESS